MNDISIMNFILHVVTCVNVESYIKSKGKDIRSKQERMIYSSSTIFAAGQTSAATFLQPTSPPPRYSQHGSDSGHFRSLCTVGGDTSTASSSGSRTHVDVVGSNRDLGP